MHTKSVRMLSASLNVMPNVCICISEHAHNINRQNAMPQNKSKCTSSYMRVTQQINMFR